MLDSVWVPPVEKRHRQRVRKIHKKKLRSVKARIDNQPPPSFRHLSNNAKARQRRNDDQVRIETENLILLTKMREQFNRHGIDNSPPFRLNTLHGTLRREHMRKIMHENEDMLKRLVERRGVYDHDQWLRESAENERRVESISKYPLVVRKKFARGNSKPAKQMPNTARAYHVRLPAVGRATNRKRQRQPHTSRARMRSSPNPPNHTRNKRQTFCKRKARVRGKVSEKSRGSNEQRENVDADQQRLVSNESGNRGDGDVSELPTRSGDAAVAPTLASSESATRLHTLGGVGDVQEQPIVVATHNQNSDSDNEMHETGTNNAPAPTLVSSESATRLRTLGGVGDIQEQPIVVATHDQNSDSDNVLNDDDDAKTAPALASSESATRLHTLGGVGDIQEQPIVVATHDNNSDSDNEVEEDDNTATAPALVSSESATRLHTLGGVGDVQEQPIVVVTHNNNSDSDNEVEEDDNTATAPALVSSESATRLHTLGGVGDVQEQPIVVATHDHSNSDNEVEEDDNTVTAPALVSSESATRLHVLGGVGDVQEQPIVVASHNGDENETGISNSDSHHSLPTTTIIESESMKRLASVGDNEGVDNPIVSSVSASKLQSLLATGEDETFKSVTVEEVFNNMDDFELNTDSSSDDDDIVISTEELKRLSETNEGGNETQTLPPSASATSLSDSLPPNTALIVTHEEQPLEPVFEGQSSTRTCDKSERSRPSTAQRQQQRPTSATRLSLLGGVPNEHTQVVRHEDRTDVPGYDNVGLVRSTSNRDGGGELTPVSWQLGNADASLDVSDTSDMGNTDLRTTESPSTGTPPPVASIPITTKTNELEDLFDDDASLSSLNDDDSDELVF